ncbi:MAG TPA: hypothetical protein DCQ06_05220 [Myxococcales bacterium]|nr:hypothetical protein [Myxococcales bacterium]
MKCFGPRSPALLVAALVCVFACQTQDNAASKSVEDLQTLIDQANRAASEAQRLSALRALQNHTDTDASLAADLALLLPIVENWAEGRERLWTPGDQDKAGEDGYLGGWFGWKMWPSSVSDNVFPPPISETSPLRPTWLLFRARMLIWQAIQNGALVETEEQRQKWFGEGRTLMTEYETLVGPQPLSGMYLDRPIAWTLDGPRLPESTPKWAQLQHEALRRLSFIARFWIEERQAVDGQLGGGWGDDVEAWRNFTSLLLAFEDPVLIAGFRKIAEGVWALPRLSGGYTSIKTDIEHSSEDTGDTLSMMLLLEPENPIWRKRALKLADLMTSLWMGTNDLGRPQFQSTWMTSSWVSSQERQACDTLYHTRAMQPALLLWQITEDPEEEKKLADALVPWLKTEALSAQSTARDKPEGIVPSALHWPSGEPGGPNSKWFNPGCHFNASPFKWPGPMRLMLRAFVLAYIKTNDAAFMAPLQSMAAWRREALKAPDANAPKGSGLWCGKQIGGHLADALGKYRLLSGDKSFDDLLTSDASEMAKYRMGIGSKPDDEKLENAWKGLRLNQAAWTTEVRWTDRILKWPKAYANWYSDLPKPDVNLLHTMTTGDVGSSALLPVLSPRLKDLPTRRATWVGPEGRQEVVLP